ncbi:MAG: TIGR03960 family B12-binding radical SAM protein [Candidatus Omnitrophica bacterium]|jgi:radical SAM family uncharacterized protein|nr:TIGR03960 family B12-binding radical SAM protein [Candidatus Omnitrophota bacterium]
MKFLQFQKPQRYIGNEWNVIKKLHFRKIKICLCYPDIYEIGMSNLGIRIIYGLLNKQRDILCERAFLPGWDLIKYLKETKQPLFSLESKTPLNHFEVIGFQLSQELNFINFLTMLELGKIPLKAEERRNIIVVGGGIANPEPLADFIDLFFLGEFEAASSNFTEILSKYKNKEDRLKALAEKEGFYVPKFYSSTSGNLEKKYPYAKLPIKRVYAKDLNNTFYPEKWLTPHIQIIHDRPQIEISRGCPNHCNFCQARAIYHPYRERKAEIVTRYIQNIYKNSGYGDLTLLSLSASDYSQIEELIDSNYDFLKKKSIGLSLPSLRIDDIFSKIYKKFSSLKKTHLTVALEAARDASRQKLNKKIDPNKLLEMAKMLRKEGLQRLKIYFMFGLPEETDEDLIAIGKFLKILSQNSKLFITVSINPFMPKPFSIWEDMLMSSEKKLLDKKDIILRNIDQKKYIKVSVSPIQKSILETIISRADRNFSKVIYKVYLQISKLSVYEEDYHWNLWKKVMEEEKIDYESYLGMDSSIYPWSFIKTDMICR